MANLIREARYIKADPVNNNNKFWNIFEYDDCTVNTEFGRVGETRPPSVKSFSSQAAASKFFDKKCKEKERDGRNGEIAYQKLDILASNTGSEATTTKVVAKSDLHTVAKKQINSDSPETSKLIDYLIKVNAHNILSSTTMEYDVETGLFTTPCGIVTQTFVDEARDFLVEIGDFVADEDYESSEFKSAVGQYLMRVPQDIGRKFDLRNLFPDLAAVQQQNAILDSLQASIDSITSAPAKAKATKGKAKEDQVFSVKLHLVDDKKLIGKIRKKYESTRQSMHSCHHLELRKVWGVDIKSVRDAFKKRGKKVGNVSSLFHGTQSCHCLSILKSGLMMPKASSQYVTGRMFSGGPGGKEGLYFSDQSTKSLNYAYGYWNGTRNSDPCYMFLCSVAMGRSYIPKSSSDGPFPHAGYDSTFAKAGTTRGLYNNEMIVYDTSQVNLDYLLEFS